MTRLTELELKKDVEAEQIDAVLDADERRRSAMHQAEEARARAKRRIQRNRSS